MSEKWDSLNTPLQDVWKAQLAPVKSRSRTLRDKKALSLASSLESLKIIFEAKMISVFDPCSRVNNSKSSTSGNRIRILSEVRCRAAIVIKSLSWRWFTFFFQSLHNFQTSCPKAWANPHLMIHRIFPHCQLVLLWSYFLTFPAGF